MLVLLDATVGYVHQRWPITRSTVALRKRWIDAQKGCHALMIGGRQRTVKITLGYLRHLAKPLGGTFKPPALIVAVVTEAGMTDEALGSLLKGAGAQMPQLYFIA